MKTAIHTVIKDEPDEYLKVWLDHHTAMVDHIFIHEDIGSRSHRHLTDQYENVTLKRITRTYEKMKQMHYIRDGVLEIQSKNEYDWCLCSDIDEFISLESPYRCLEDVLTGFQEFDGVLLQWQNFGASGHVFKPDYNGRDYRDFYTEPANDTKWDGSMRLNTKVFWNLNRVTEYNLSGVHFGNGTLARADSMHLKHYITKSWEEYVWKIYVRGCHTGKRHRSDRDFFEINPDMVPMHDELIEIKNKLLKNIYKNG